MSEKRLDQYYPGLADKCRRAYNLTIDAIRDAAKSKGYAIGVHGSLARDIDLIAVPWTEEAAPAEELVQAVMDAAEKHGPAQFAFLNPNHQNPTEKPHGRLCWSIHLGGGPYLDLAVMPRATARVSDERAKREDRAAG